MIKVTKIKSTSFRIITDKKPKQLSEKKMEALKTNCSNNYFQMLKERTIKKVETPFFVLGYKIK